MSTRFPPIPPSLLEGERRELYEEIVKGCHAIFGGKNFTYIRPDGALLGPFSIMMYLPINYARQINAFQGAIFTLPALSHGHRETAVLTVGRHFGAEYEMYAHSRAAVASGALSEEQVADIMAETCPRGTDERGAPLEASWALAKGLLESKGPLPNGIWQKSEAALGRTAALSLIQFVGGFSFLALMMNGCDIRVPEEKEKEPLRN